MATIYSSVTPNTDLMSQSIAEGNHKKIYTQDYHINTRNVHSDESNSRHRVSFNDDIDNCIGVELLAYNIPNTTRSISSVTYENVPPTNVLEISLWPGFFRGTNMYVKGKETGVSMSTGGTFPSEDNFDKNPAFKTVESHFYAAIDINVEPLSNDGLIEPTFLGFVAREMTPYVVFTGGGGTKSFEELLVSDDQGTIGVYYDPALAQRKIYGRDVLLPSTVDGYTNSDVQKAFETAVGTLSADVGQFNFTNILRCTLNKWSETLPVFGPDGYGEPRLLWTNERALHEDIRFNSQQNTAGRNTEDDIRNRNYNETNNPDGWQLETLMDRDILKTLEEGLATRWFKPNDPTSPYCNAATGDNITWAAEAEFTETGNFNVFRRNVMADEVELNFSDLTSRHGQTITKLSKCVELCGFLHEHTSEFYTRDGIENFNSVSINLPSGNYDEQHEAAITSAVDTQVKRLLQIMAQNLESHANWPSGVSIVVSSSVRFLVDSVLKTQIVYNCAMSFYYNGEHMFDYDSFVMAIDATHPGLGLVKGQFAMPTMMNRAMFPVDHKMRNVHGDSYIPKNTKVDHGFYLRSSEYLNVAAKRTLFLHMSTQGGEKLAAVSATSSKLGLRFPSANDAFAVLYVDANPNQRECKSFESPSPFNVSFGKEHKVKHLDIEFKTINNELVDFNGQDVFLTLRLHRAGTQIKKGGGESGDIRDITQQMPLDPNLTWGAPRQSRWM